jgi:glutamine cyclotransferase
MKTPLIYLLLLFFLVSCKQSQNTQNKESQSTENTSAVKTNLIITTIAGNNTFMLGDSIQLYFNKSSEHKISSIQAEINEDKYSIDPESESYWIKTGVNNVGSHRLMIKYTINDSLVEKDYLTFIYHSRFKPKELEYKLINTYKHDTKAYTQGLLYHNGYLYESTGHRGQSSVRKVEVETGRIVKLTSLESKYFGEGLAIINNNLFQITWQSQVGFVYDLESLRPLREVQYNIMEGWGLTYDGNQLIMSDGSAKLYFIDDSYFTENARQEIYMEKEMTTFLNELEYVNGKVYANVYGEKYIVGIDPKTGEVIEKIDFADLFPKNIPDNSDHVLNGIAYNPETKHFYITGKYWPVIHEVQILY